MTAVALALGGVGLFRAADAERWAAGLTTVAATLVSVQALQQQSGRLGLDGWLGATATDPGAVGIVTGLSVVALAVVSVLRLPHRRALSVSAELLALVVSATSGTLALSWLLARVEGVAVPSATSPLTSGALLVLAMGWLRLTAVHGVLLRPLVRDTAPARSMRRLLAWLAGTVTLLVVAVRLGTHDGPLADPSVRSAVTVIVVLVAMLFVAAWAARDLEEAGADLRRSEGLLRHANLELLHVNAELEERVAARTVELEERNRQLERSNEELDRFASVASHDLQEPLRMVSAYTELLAREHATAFDADAHELMDFVLDGAARMQDLIDDLLEYSRLRTRGDDHLPVDLAEVLADVTRGLRLTIEESRARVTVGDLPVVLGDPTQLRMLFHNLLGNAVKYRGEWSPSIAVGAEAGHDPGIWLVRVSDNGIGIPAADRERIFLPFRRLHARSRYPGTGIGLAICRRIVEQHGGQIWVEPNDRGGSTFCLTLHDADTGAGGGDDH